MPAYGDVAIEGLISIVKGKIPEPQTESNASYCAKRQPSDGYIDFNKSATDIFNIIRALSSPYPGAFAYYEEKKVIIEKAHVVEKKYNYVGNIPGSLIRAKDIWVLCGSGILAIDAIKVEVNEVQISDPKEFFINYYARINQMNGSY